MYAFVSETDPSERVKRRAEQLRTREGGTGVDEDDLPDDAHDGVSYYSADEGQGWKHLEQMEDLLESKGREAVAGHALDELDEFEGAIESFEQSFLKLYQAVEEGRELEAYEWSSIQGHASEIENGDDLAVEDSSVKYTDSLRAALVTLGEEAEDGDLEEADG